MELEQHVHVSKPLLSNNNVDTSSIRLIIPNEMPIEIKDVFTETH